MTETRRQTVLIVDDQPNWRRTLSRVLEDDYEVISVESYEKALKALLDQDPPFHAAVVDIRLDDKDEANEEGLRLVEELNRRGEYTSIIVVTGYPTVRTVKKALRDLAASGYVEKYPIGGKFDIVAFRRAVREACVDAEKRRPRRFVRQGNRVLVIEEDNSLRIRLVDTLRRDGYEVEDMTTPHGLVQKLGGKAFNLLILKQDAQLYAQIREHEPGARIIALIPSNIGDIVKTLQTEAVHGIVAIQDGDFNAQEFREAVRSVFSFAANKYVCAWLEKSEPLQVGQSHVLVLSLQDLQEPGKSNVSVWLPPRGEKRTETVLRLSIFAPDVDIQAGQEAYWEIPPLGAPPLFRTEIVPRTIGKHTIAIDIECGKVWLGRLKKDFEVVDKPPA